MTYSDLSPGLQQLVSFSGATFLFWVFVYLVVFRVKSYVTVENTRGAEFADFLAGHFLLLFAAYFLGALGGSVAMHQDGSWAQAASDTTGMSIFGRLIVSGVTGMLSYLALVSGALRIFLQADNATEVKPTFVSIMLFALLFGMFATQVIENAGAQFGDPQETATPPAPQQP